MTFTRQRSDGTHETNSFKTLEQTQNALLTPEAPCAQQTGSRFLSFRSTSLPLKNILTFALTAFAITVPTLLPAEARYYSRYSRNNKSRTYQKATRASSKKAISRADEVTTGVWGWTKSKHTYLRVRPDADMPFVAKVPRQTKLFVWGKFNGWYRVETPDHIFGWVFHQYVNAPEEHKLKQLSHAKAKVACDRSAKQLMYGSADSLQKYYTSYKAPGAMRGLEKMGIRVASSKTPAKSKNVVAKAAPKVVTPKVVTPKVVTPKVATTQKVAPKVVKAPIQTAPVTAPSTFAAVAPGTGNTVQPAAPTLIPVQKPAPARTKTVVQQEVKRQPSRTVSSRTRRNVKRQQKKTVVGVPPMKVTGSSAITAADILRAREAHLGSRHKTQPTPPQSKLPPRIEEKPAGNSSQAVVQPSSADAFTAPALPSPLTSAGEVSSVVTIVSLKKAPAKAKASTPAAKAQPNRGGSPRDFARYAQEQNKNGLGDGIATQALSYRGMPYIRGSASPKRGFDCSGLVYHLLRSRGYNPPRTASGLASYGTPVAKDKLQPGDIVLFANTYRRGVSHVGIYHGNGKFVHAANSRSGVRVDPLFSGYYGKKYYGARRVKAKK